MAILFMDGFDHYGYGLDGSRNMLDGVYAAVGSASNPNTDAIPERPSFGARTGTGAFRLEPQTAVGNFIRELRLAIPQGAQSEVFVALGLYAEILPNNTDVFFPFDLRDANNVTQAKVCLRPNGSLQVQDGDGNAVSTTSGPVVSSGAWNHVEVRFVPDTGVFEIRVNEEEKLAGSGLSLGSSDIGIVSVNTFGNTGDEGVMWVDDLVVSNTAGTLNNTWNGDIRVATLFPDAQGDSSDWTNYPRQKIGERIAEVLTEGAHRNGPDEQLDMALAAGDYTLEAFVRFRELPSTDDAATIFAHWNTNANQRGWRLFKGGANVNGGNLVFETSTNGALATVEAVHSVEWQPRVGQWYHIAVCRVSGENRLFIDGRQRGSAQSDSRNYHLPDTDAAAPSIGGRPTTSKFTQVDVLAGFLDEVRWTVGVGRYSSNFTPPTTPYPRSAPADPDFSSTVTLLGFEDDDLGAPNTLVDQSAAALEWRNNDMRILEPNDALNKYRTVNESAPIDDNYVAADFLPATAQLLARTQPSASETIEIGSTTYTFVASLSAADDVLIGANVDATLNNLIAAVNGGAGEGTVYGTGTEANTDASAALTAGNEITFTALTQGAAGNSLTASTDITDATLSSFSGGADIPGPQDFGLSPLPPLTTQVRAVQLTPRLSKTDSGTAKVQLSLRSATGDLANGADRPVTPTPTYYADILETDPSTSGALTPTSIQTATVRVNRTA